MECAVAAKLRRVMGKARLAPANGADDITS